LPFISLFFLFFSLIMTEAVQNRNQGLCELCNTGTATEAYTVSPRSEDAAENQVALCPTCLEKTDAENESFYWRCLEGSIWSAEPAVQALSYRILHRYKEEGWVSDLLASVDLDEQITQWALSAYEVPEVHKDAFGNILSSGDTVVLTQALQVKGANFTASKGTVVKRIKLVPDNTGQIEGKINEQTIVILTRYVKKG
jgi:protein PhnA